MEKEYWTILNWVVMLGIGVGLIGMGKYIFGSEVAKVREVREKVDKIPSPSTILTETRHHTLCKDALVDVRTMIKESRDITTEQYKTLTSFLQLEVRNQVLELKVEQGKMLLELRRKNGSMG